MLHRLSKGLYLLNSFLVGAALAVMLAIILGLVVSRYVIGTSPFWGEELARYTMFYLINLGTALALRHNQHPRLTIVSDLLKGPFARGARIIVFAAIAATLMLLLWQGYAMAVEEGMFTTPALRWSFYWVYLAVPIGAVASLIQLVAREVEPEPALGQPEPEDALT